MKSKFLLATVFILAVSCGKISPKGDEISVKDFKVNAFNKVDLQGNFHAFFIKTDSSFVSAETYPNIIDNLQISVKDSVLSISEKTKTENVDFYNITLYSTKDLRSVTISDSADLQLSTQIMSNDFLLKLKDNSKFSGSILSNKAEVEMNGKSKANFLGKTLDAEIKIKDSAQIISPTWYVKNLKISALNQTFTEINVEENLSGNVENTSKLVYYGEPTKKLTQKDKAVVNQK